jgi:hypothetical protein
MHILQRHAMDGGFRFREVPENGDRLAGGAGREGRVFDASHHIREARRVMVMTAMGESEAQASQTAAHAGIKARQARATGQDSGGIRQNAIPEHGQGVDHCRHEHVARDTAHGIEHDRGFGQAAMSPAVGTYIGTT